MYPHERSLVRTLADKPFAIIGVNSDKLLDDAKEACELKNLSWRSFANDQGEEKISDKWKIRGWPTTFLIDKDGVIRYKGLRGNDLDAAIEKLMAEMDIEVNLSEVDHEAEDETAMEAYKESLEAKKAPVDDDATAGDDETPGESEEKSDSKKKSETKSESKEASTSK